MKQAIVRKISVFIFSVGVLIGFLLAAGTVWAHLEMPVYFDYSYTAMPASDKGNSALNCPIILTNADSGMVSVDITNTTDKLINIRFQGEISYKGSMSRFVQFSPAIPVGETNRIQFEVNKKDVVYHSMILVRTYQFSTYKTPSRMGSCAILVIPISFLTGNELLILVLLTSGLFIILGLVLWIRSNHPMVGTPRNALTAMTSMSLLLLAAVFSGISGWFIPGILLLVLIILLAVVTVGYFQSSPTSNRF